MRLTQAEVEDILLGSFFGLCFIGLIGPWATVSFIAGALFWYLGGRYGNSWQVYGCSTSYFLPLYFIYQQPLVIITAIMCGLFMSMGYGVVTYFEYKDEETGAIYSAVVDKGSTLGRFFYKLTDGNIFWTNFFTRGLIYCGISSSIILSYLICFLL